MIPRRFAFGRAARRVFMNRPLFARRTRGQAAFRFRRAMTYPLLL
jgi:hypothetical protein